MATMPTTLTPQDVGEIVKTKTTLYQPEGPRIPGDPRYADKPSNATPANMRALLDELDLYTQAVGEAATDEGLTDDAVQAQWSADMANWQYRLAHYYQVLQAVPAQDADTLQGADAIYFQVTAPLLDGVYYDPLPGIVLSQAEKERMAQEEPPGGFSNPKPPDLYIPFSLGNQVLVYRQHQRERWELLWKDLAQGVRTLGGLVPEHDPFAVLRHALVTVGAGLLGGGIVYTVIKAREFRKRRQIAAAAAAAPSF